MVALFVVLGAVVLLLAVLVAGLLRSHADILKALHDLGAGVGDPAADRAHDHGGHGTPVGGTTPRIRRTRHTRSTGRRAASDRFPWREPRPARRREG